MIDLTTLRSCLMMKSSPECVCFFADMIIPVMDSLQARYLNASNNAFDPIDPTKLNL